jgi:O-antigen/teichoic acid export membrane protein
MGIIVNQSIKNTIITFIGFAIGAINALFLYTKFLGDDYYGLTTFLLSTATILMPFLAFGVQNTLIKFYAEQPDENAKAKFLNFMLVLPWVVVTPLVVFFILGYPMITSWLSKENQVISDYVWLIPVLAIFMAYFEICYAWVKVHFKSVFGNFIKEVLLRLLVSFLLFGVYKQWLSQSSFVYALTFVYFLVFLLMAITAFSIKKPNFSLGLPKKIKPIVVYSSFIIFSSSIAVMLLDIDKFMIGQMIPLREAAYYSVAIFIALTISIPLRAMHQITHPITTTLMANKSWEELNVLYKKTSITLQVVGGWLLIGILTNIHSVYALLPEKYTGGIVVVFLIAISKFFDVMLGNNNSIILNSKYYKSVLLLGIILVFVTIGLNQWLIPKFGIVGAAVATLISIFVYSLSKLLFVVFKMKLFPFTRKTIISLAIILLVFLCFYFWNFKTHPLISILLKSVLITIVYFGLVIATRVSNDINSLLISLKSKIILKNKMG